MTRQETFSQILDDIKVRSTWESRQRTWYEMRHNGIRRRSKPWPGASDLHYPLSDTIIAKLKPYYFEQLFASENLASFTSCEKHDEATVSGVANWFDYKLKEQSNLETEILSCIDHMLTSGRSVLKISWSADDKRVRFDAVHPLRIIVPRNTIDAESCYRMVHVMVMSVADYKRHTEWKQDETFIDLIKGRSESQEEHDKAGLYTSKELREGITCGERDDDVVVWEVWSRKDSKWVVSTFSPAQPETDIRTEFEHPYRHGIIPFVDFTYEIKDKGWFSPRGIPELVAAHEASLCKLWNEKHDCITLYNRPLYRSAQNLPGVQNLQLHPGQILPYDISPIQHGQPPISFDQEMISTRQIAEQRVAMPDYGMNQVMSARDRRTATEIESINEVMGNASDLRMRIFRRSLGRVYFQAWEILREFKSDELEYVVSGQVFKLDENALKGDYVIKPHGSADGVNKTFNMKKALSRFQMFNSDPFINQVELRRSVLNSDDPALVKTLLTDPNIKTASQMEDQAQEITILAEGFPAQVLPSDDHVIHIQTCVQFLQSRAELNFPYSPVAHQRLMEHMIAHLDMLRESDPKMARQVEKGLQVMFSQQAQPGAGKDALPGTGAAMAAPPAEPAVQSQTGPY